jgi:hypothetical protein
MQPAEAARRLVGALIRAPGDKKVEKSKVVRKVLVRMVEAGANVQWIAHKRNIVGVSRRENLHT